MSGPATEPAVREATGSHGRPRRRRLLKRVAVVVVACTVVPTLFLYLAQDQLIYGPVQHTPPIGTVLPGGEEVSYRTRDGVDVRSWFLPATPSASAARAPSPVAIVFHGTHGERSSMAPFAQELARHGVAVLLAEYRGFGDVEGALSEQGLHEDALAAVTYVQSRPDLDPSHIAYVGYSLGTGVAVSLSVVRPPAALVLLAPYTSLPDVAWSSLPGLPYRLLMRTQFDSRSRIGRLHVPLLVVRGSADRTIPPEQSAEVFAIANEPKQLLTIDGADHDLRAPGAPSTASATLQFLSSLGGV